MARINLLPWRQEERERKNKEFITLVIAVALLTVIALGAVWSYFNQQLSEQQRANELVEQENKNLDAQLTEIEDLEQRREDIISRMKVIQDLQGHRPIPVHIWDDVARAVPSAMYLTNFKREGDTLTFTGYADNPNVISNFIRNLDASEWMGNSAVRNIQQNIAAYQTPQPTNQLSKESDAQQVYPEENYVQFVVTTQVQSPAPDQSQSDDAEQPQPAEATGGN